jgi:ribosomal protein L11 methyltransferase
MTFSIHSWGLILITFIYGLSAWKIFPIHFNQLQRKVLQQSVLSTPNSLDRKELTQLIIQFNCDEIDPDEFSELLHEMGTSSVSVEVDLEKEVLNDEKQWSDLVKIKSWATAVLKAIVPSSFDTQSLVNIVREVYPTNHFDVRTEPLQDRDWIMYVQQLWHPQDIGNLMVCLPWHDIEELKANYPPTKHFLQLEGGAAFGTGDHPTTRLCLKWLESEVHQYQGKVCNVLDYGCGSGLLGFGK